MDDEMDIEIIQEELEKSVEAQRKLIVSHITMESPQLVDELLKIIYNHDLDEQGRAIVDAKIKLPAIAMLLDRSIPKLGVDNTKQEVVEETHTRKKMREEIEALVRGEKDSKALEDM